MSALTREFSAVQRELSRWSTNRATIEQKNGLPLPEKTRIVSDATVTVTKLYWLAEALEAEIRDAAVRLGR